MSKVFVSLTFDYEIFFSENFFNYDNVLFNPSDQILELSKLENIPFVWFIDILSYVRHSQLSDLKSINYCKKFSNQIKKMNSLNQDIQLHIHPHWIKGTYDHFKMTWDIPPHCWSLGDILEKDGYKKTEEIIDSSIKTLTDLAENPPVSFRAGGYCIQKNERVIMKLLESKGIKIDSSVLPNCYLKSSYHNYNYLNTPPYSHWPISSETGVGVFNKSGNLIEAPVTTIKKNKILKDIFIKKIKEKIYHSKKPRKGRGILSFKEKSINRGVRLSFDHSSDINLDFLLKIFNRLLSLYKNEYVSWINILSHPKSMDDESIDVLKKFIYIVKTKYKNVRFCTHADVSNGILQE
ncbi:MAG: hypothetical protein OXB84_08320 [Halobacteriovoraceae bacterium]|nr:hypothetical protein [Halobacteriovoraceae bacterium]